MVLGQTTKSEVPFGCVSNTDVIYALSAVDRYCAKQSRKLSISQALSYVRAYLDLDDWIPGGGVGIHDYMDAKLLTALKSARNEKT
jgi:hypothetical protein